jgi:hypothetical protein
VTVTVSGSSSFSTSSAPNGGHGTGFYGSNSATMNLDVQSGTQFTNIRSIGIQAHGLGDTQMTVKVTGSTFTNTGSAGMDIATKDSADTKFNVTSNTMTGQGATAININLGGAPTGTQNATLQGNISANTLSPLSGASGISLDANTGQVGQGGSVTATVTNNQISISAGSANSINALGRRCAHPQRHDHQQHRHDLWRRHWRRLLPRVGQDHHGHQHGLHGGQRQQHPQQHRQRDPH